MNSQLCFESRRWPFSLSGDDNSRQSCQRGVGAIDSCGGLNHQATRLLQQMSKPSRRLMFAT